MPLSDKDLEAIDKLPDPSSGGDGSGTGLLPRGGGFKQGLAQSALGLAEAPAQWAERGVQQFAPDFRIVPQGVRDWARDYRREAESTPMGLAGEATGDIGMMFIPGLDWLKGPEMIAKGARGAEAASRAAEATKAAGPAMKAIGGPAWKAVAPVASAVSPAVKAGAVATLQQPVSGRDFNSEKINQFVNGAGLQGLAQLAGRLPPQVFQAVGHAMGVPRWLSHAIQGVYAPTAGLAGIAARAAASRPGLVGAIGGQAPVLSQGRTGAAYGPEE